MYVVLLNGPRLLTIPIQQAFNKEDAAAKALRLVEYHPDQYGRGKYKVEKVITEMEGLE